VIKGKPAEVLIAAAIAGAGGLVFVLVAVIRQVAEGGSGLVGTPVVIALVELLVGAGLLFRLKIAHIGAMIVFFLVGLLHLLIALADGPLWARVVSGVLSAVHVYGVVVLNTGPARNYLGGPR
jgi:hypothetical protein